MTLREQVLAANHAYVALKSCGCGPGICVDLADKWTARSVSEWIRKGYAVERLPHDEAVKKFGWCDAHRPAKQVRLL